MSIPLPPHEAAPLMVPLRDALVALAVLAVLALACNLCLFAYLAAHIHFPSPPPSPGGRECVWEKGPGDEGSREGASRPEGKSHAH